MNEMTFDEAIEALQHAVYGEEVRYAIARALVLSMNTQQSVAGKEDASNKVTSMDSNSTNDQYPSAKSVYDALSGKENSSNKKTTLTGNESRNDFYPTTKAVADALNTKAPLSTAYTVDSMTTEVPFDVNNPKIIYLNAVVDGESGIVITSAHNASNASFQIFFGRNGTTKIRYFTGGTSYSDWIQVTELVGNKKNSITSSNKTSTDFYPSIKAVVDYLTANYIGNGNNTVSWANLAAAVQTLINGKESSSNKQSSITAVNKTSTTLYPSIKAVVDYLAANYENLSNKLTSQTGINSDSTDTEYPTAKAVFDFGTDILTEVEGDLVLKENLSNKKNAIAGNETSGQYYPTTKAVYDYLVANYENLSNKLTSEEGIDSDSTDTQYPSAKAVYDLGVEIVGLVNDDISNVESRLVLKESSSNKQSSITAVNKASTALYPSIKAVYDYGSQITNNIEDVKAYIGYTDGDILGLHADFENKVFTRLGAAVGLTAGQDFNAFPMYGQRRRVVVDSDGVIVDGYSPEDVGESDTDVDVMVYQPKFYYKVVPLKLEKQSSGLGYHIRKANYYISSTPHAGFKLHPLFYDANGNEIDYVLFSAYEASYMWSRQVSTNGTDFRYVDSIFHDGVDTDTTIETSAVLKSLPGVKPISGQYKAMTKVNLENCALRKSPNWHLDTIQSVAANQLLMAIEYGTFNTQSAIGQGIVTNNSNGTNNCASLTGSTSAETFNTASGMANETIYDVAGTETPYSENGKVAVTYRGIENPWGNIWKHVNGINIWGDGTMNGGQAYIADNFNFNEEVKGETTINNVHYKYSSAGFTISNSNGYISAFGYGDEEFDWLFMPSETIGNNLIPVGDYLSCTANLNGDRIALLGGTWNKGDYAGGFGWYCRSTPNTWFNDIGGRLLFVPTATV